MNRILIYCQVHTAVLRALWITKIEKTVGNKREKDISISFIKTYYFVFYGIVILSMSNFVIA